MGKYLDKEGVKKIWTKTKNLVDGIVDKTGIVNIFKLVDELPDVGEENKIYLMSKGVLLRWNGNESEEVVIEDASVNPYNISVIKINNTFFKDFEVYDAGDDIFEIELPSCLISFTDVVISVTNITEPVTSVTFYSATANDAYEEYSYINGKWELMGTTKADFDLSEIQEEINQVYLNMSEVVQSIANIYNYVEAKTFIITSGDFNLEVSGIITHALCNRIKDAIIDDARIIYKDYNGNYIYTCISSTIVNQSTLYLTFIMPNANTSKVINVVITYDGYPEGDSRNQNVVGWCDVNSFNIAVVDATNTGFMLPTDKVKLDTIYKEWYGTQSEYDELGTYDNNTKYFILEE